MTELARHVYAIDQNGCVCLNLDNTIAHMEGSDQYADDDPMLVWLQDARALAQEWAPDQLRLDHSPTAALHVVAGAVLQALDEQDDDAALISTIRLANLCALSWGGNRGFASTLREMTGMSR